MQIALCGCTHHRPAKGSADLAVLGPHAQDAADNERLTSTTYQRLMLACGVKSLGYLAAFAQVCLHA